MYKKILTLALFSAVSFGFLAPVDAKMTKEALQLYSSALKFENQKRYTDALDLLLKALQTSSDDMILNTKIAGLYSELGEFDKALEYYQKTLKLKPDDAFLYISIGNILQMQQKYEDAIDAYEQARIIAPNYKYNYINIANTLFLSERYDEAVENYKVFLQYYPDNNKARINIASSYLQKKDYKMAQEAYLKALEMNPDEFSDYASMGLAFLRDKKFREYSWKNNRYDWSFRAVEVRLEMFRKNPKPPIEMGKQMTYALTNSEYNGITGDYKYFNLPLVADIAFICEKEDLVNAYKNICISPETLKLMQGSKLGYLKNAAIFFTDTNDIDLALKLAGLADNKHQKLRILNSIALQMPPESEFVEKFFRALISEK